MLGRLLVEPARPFVAVVGGSKIHDKLGVLRSLADKADFLLIGGAMAFTFFAALGRDVGASLLDVEHIASCEQLLRDYKNIVLPSDVLALEPGGVLGAAPPAVGPRSDTKVMGQELPYGWKGLDIGPDTADAFADHHRRRPHRVLERPARGHRGRPVRLGHQAGRRGGGGLRRLHHGRGRRQRHGGRHPGPGRADQLRLDRGGASLSLIENGDLPALAALRGAPNAPAAQTHRR